MVNSIAYDLIDKGGCYSIRVTHDICVLLLFFLLFHCGVFMFHLVLVAVPSVYKCAQTLVHDDLRSRIMVETGR